MLAGQGREYRNHIIYRHISAGNGRSLRNDSTCVSGKKEFEQARHIWERRGCKFQKPRPISACHITPYVGTCRRKREMRSFGNHAPYVGDRRDFQQARPIWTGEGKVQKPRPTWAGQGVSAATSYIGGTTEGDSQLGMCGP